MSETVDLESVQTQYDTMPSASGNAGKVVQYVGTTTANYTNGYFYKCVAGQTAGTYEWQNIDVQAQADSSNVSYR